MQRSVVDNLGRGFECDAEPEVRDIWDRYKSSGITIGSDEGNGSINSSLRSRQVASTIHFKIIFRAIAYLQRTWEIYIEHDGWDLSNRWIVKDQSHWAFDRPACHVKGEVNCRKRGPNVHNANPSRWRCWYLEEMSTVSLTTQHMTWLLWQLSSGAENIRRDRLIHQCVLSRASDHWPVLLTSQCQDEKWNEGG